MDDDFSDEALAYRARAELHRQLRILERLKPAFREVDRAAYDVAAAAVVSNGLLLLRQAYSNARAALASGIPRRIVYAVVQNSELLTGGLAAAVASEIRQRRSKGGKTRGAQRAAEAAAAKYNESKWHDRWRELCASRGPREARGIHQGELRAAHIEISDRQHRRLFRPKK